MKRPFDGAWIRRLSVPLLTVLSMIASPAKAAHERWIGFSGLERQLIVSYYETERGIVRYPAIGEHAPLRRGQPLTEGRNGDRLPRSLEASLPALPPGYIRAVVDGRIVLIEESTRTVSDVLPDIVVVGQKDSTD